MKKPLILFTLLLASYTLCGQTLTDCSECSSRLIKDYELSGITKADLRLLKNEIFARRGYTFSSKDLKEYFAAFAWYNPLNNNSSIKFTQTEQKNIDLIDNHIKNGDDFEDYEPILTDGFVANSKHKYLSEEDVERIFDNNKKHELGIDYDIWKVYDYSDATGDYYLVLTEHRRNLDEPEASDEYNNKIKAFNYKRNGTQLTKTFETYDFTSDNYSEHINFYTRYILVEDIDADGIVEPIIVYGIHGFNGFDDSNVKILIYHKGVKIGVRITNSLFDDGRFIQVDSTFYSLPEAIKNRVIVLMDEMENNNHCLYPHVWKQDISKKKLKITD